MPIDPVQVKSNIPMPSLGSGRLVGAASATPQSPPKANAASPTDVQVPEVSLASDGFDTSPTFDVHRVSQIRAAIADGSFKVDAEAVAEGLIATVRDLIRNNPRQA